MTDRTFIRTSLAVLVFFLAATASAQVLPGYGPELEAFAVSSREIHLAWTWTPRPTASFSGLEVRRAASEQAMLDGDYVVLETLSVTARGYEDLTGLTPGQPYAYRVSPRVAATIPLYMDHSGVAVETTSETIFDLYPPFHLRARSAVDTINLSWVCSSRLEDGYIVERAEGADGDFVTVATLAPNTYVYSDADVTTGVPYRYRVTAWARFLTQQVRSRAALAEARGPGWWDATPAALTGGDYWSPRAAAWTDFDHDGDPDLFVATDAGNRLLRNDGDGVFTPCADALLTGAGNPTRACAWGDFDNDGDPDVYLARASAPLLRNNGDGSFSDASGLLGVAGDLRPTWVDVDLDGRLDLHLLGTHRSELYRNTGSGFARVAPGTDDPGFYLAPFQDALWSDLDGDGDPDLFLATAQGYPNYLMWNRGGAVFDVTYDTPFLDDANTTALAAADLNEDGLPEVLVARGPAVPPAAGSAPMVLENRGDGEFLARLPGLPVVAATDAALADFDHDGMLDIHLAGADGIRLLRGDGISFTDETPAVLAAGGRRRAVFADVDGDGHLDAYVYDDPAAQPGRLVMSNVTRAGRWLEVGLEGCPGRGNREARGAVVEVYENAQFISPTPTHRFRQAGLGGGTRGQHDPLVHVALPATKYDVDVRVVWPRYESAGGYRHETVVTVPKDALETRIVIREPCLPAAVDDGPDRTPAPAGPVLHDAYPNPFNPRTRIVFELPDAGRVRLRVFDLRGRLVRTLHDDALLAAGRHEAVWRGRDDGGRPVAAGLYLYRLEAGGRSTTKRMMLVK